MAIVSTEMVLYSAGKQGFSAARLCEKLNSRALAEASEPELDPAKVETSHNWVKALTRRVSDSRTGGFVGCEIEN